MWNGIKRYKVWILFAFYLNLFRLTLVVLILSLYLYLNFSKYSVYYAKHIPHDEGRDPEVEMLIKNIARAETPEIEGVTYTPTCIYGIGNCLKYSIDGINSEDTKTPKYLRSVIMGDSKNEIEYIENHDIYLFNEKYKLILFNERLGQEKPVSNINEFEIKKQVRTIVQPVINVQPKPMINLQWLFNWWYKDYFRNEY
ncbi:hypothetical protein [Mammaliicoccus sciuri]|uniref:hypothetical protein n=1 Tax=Mammaliicoccus sciuri TaxID=1296 RepID=UPI002DB6487B|nr:hypothetical protein [Mammaliicoccus sciuri]MEB7050724.1 hypothetical protein [Mammaliicoccus sciuri]